MISPPWTKLGLIAACTLLTATALAQDEHAFQLHSTEFVNDSTPPLSMIFNNPVNGVNTCTASGAAGLDQSPELFWTGAPRDTQSFVVVLYDTTAAFTHWGMYNISADTRKLPHNAGAANSPYGPRS